MNEASSGTRSVVVERDLPYPAGKVWRALTEPHLIAEWLMKNDFSPRIGHRFRLSGDWGGVDCEVLTVEENRKLAYSWAAFGLDSIATFTLTPTAGGGTRLRMEQSGFRADQTQFYEGATASWPGFMAALEEVVARLD